MNRIKLLTICWVVSFLPFRSLPAQIIGPYLQSPDATSIIITWKTGQNTDSRVWYGADSTALVGQASGSCQVMSDNGYDNNYFYHNVRLSNLQPNQYYYYRVATGSLQSAIYRFRTQPPAGQAPAVYRILVLGDHQLKGNNRYQKLMEAARNKVREKYGGPIEEYINLIINDGDQVDEGTLDQYENVHIGPSSVLSGNIPVMTTVGNHELYGSLGITAYYDHYFYDKLGYRSIKSPGGENYYSYQQGNIVFLHLSSEHPTEEQAAWVQKIVDSVKRDNSVSWLVSIAHKPIQAEQFVGDISTYMRNTIMPILVKTDKSVLFIAGHHHLYARGQLRDYPMYHIISGAASWDQYWGQSTEKDFDDVQKTIDYWTYQIVTFDEAKKEMSVECYAIGSPKLGLTINNELIDRFYRKPGVVPPYQPAILRQPADSVTLPYTVESTPFFTQTGELMNSTQYQVASDSLFRNCSIDLIRDYENLYGTTGSPDYKPVDIHKNVNILNYTIGKNKLPNGTWFVRTRHRDRNIAWSAWSAPVKIKIKGSLNGLTGISTSKKFFNTGEDIVIQYTYGPGNAKDWIGIYKSGDIPGQTASTDWIYASGTSGTVTLHVTQPGSYFIGFFENDGYAEICDRISVYVGKIPVLTLDKAGYGVGETVQVAYSNAPFLAKDWIGIYRLDDIPGQVGSIQWSYTSGASGTISFSGLAAGYYFVCYFLEDLYSEACERTIFSVGADLATVKTDRSTYQQGQTIQVEFKDGPGTAGDWIGLFRNQASPGIPPLVSRKDAGPLRSGTIAFDNQLDSGDYFAALLINNSSVRISNKALFTVESGSGIQDPAPESNDILFYPVPNTGRFRIRSSILKDRDVNLILISSTGCKMLEKPLHPTGSINSDEIDLSGFSPGIYLVFLRTGEKVLTGRIILNR